MYSIWEKLNPKEKRLLLGFYGLSLVVVGLLAYGLGREQVQVPSATASSLNAPAPVELFPVPSTTSDEGETLSEESLSVSETSQAITVHVAGAVKNPGVYTLPSESRVADALQRAGGAVEDSDLNTLNLAETLQDGQQTYVPRKSESNVSAPTPPRNRVASRPSRERLQVDFPLDINRATAEELELLPGIGAVLARRIVEYRQQVGRFHSVEELRQVRGIGAKRLEQIRPLVIVR